MLADEISEMEALGVQIGGHRILDVGCDDGVFVGLVSTAGASLAVGCDVNLASLLDRAASARTCAPSDDCATALVCNSPDSLPFRTAAFDVVTCIDVLEHVSDVERVLSEIARVLSPCGVAYVRFQHFEMFSAHHAGRVLKLPWSHLMLNSQELTLLVKWARERMIASRGTDNGQPLELPYLNRLRANEFAIAAQLSGLSPRELRLRPLSGKTHPVVGLFSRLMGRWSRLRPFVSRDVQAVLVHRADGSLGGNRQDYVLSER